MFVFNNIRAKFKHLDKNLKSKFKDSSCILTISVGQEVHEGEKFLKTVDLVNESFKSCTILVDDVLQRYTMALGNSKAPSFYYELSKKEGDLWLKRNEKYYKNLSNLKEIFRWEDFLNHPDYKEKELTIKKSLEQEMDYKNAFQCSISEFLDRYYSRLEHKNNFDHARATKLCHEYLLEECAVFYLLKDLDFQFEVYPAKRNLALHMTHEKFISQNNKNVLDAICIKFINKKQLKPQEFKLLTYHKGAP